MILKSELFKHVSDTCLASFEKLTLHGLLSLLQQNCQSHGIIPYKHFSSKITILAVTHVVLQVRLERCKVLWMKLIPSAIWAIYESSLLLECRGKVHVSLHKSMTENKLMTATGNQTLHFLDFTLPGLQFSSLQHNPLFHFLRD